MNRHFPSYSSLYSRKRNCAGPADAICTAALAPVCCKLCPRASYGDGMRRLWSPILPQGAVEHDNLFDVGLQFRHCLL